MAKVELSCDEQYELKSKSGRIGAKMVDGAYAAMVARVQAPNRPNLLLLGYRQSDFCVRNLVLVPKFFLTEQIIERRPPLPAWARRGGWVGCNILIPDIPAMGRIDMILDGQAVPKAVVLAKWRRTLFLREHDLAARGWLVEVLRCIERLGTPTFTLAAVYGFEEALSRTFPANRNVRAKIRQQLQALRDRQVIQFLGRGLYALVATA